ncbi:MAG: hypothetical protein P4L16_01595 [Chlamydiales bacterium]|nr:hypothetical protein [Chlamydiales bacterium]
MGKEDSPEDEDNNKDESENESPFREGVVDRLSSPEQLDRVMIVVRPKGWIALLCLGFLILIGLVWAFVGRIPIEVDGRGVILTERGLFSIYSTINGLVAETNVKVGDWVTPETVVAKIRDQALIDQIREQELKVETLNASMKAAVSQKSEQEQNALNLQLEAEKILLADLKRKPSIVNVYASNIGKVIEYDVTVGSVVGFGTPIAWAHHALREDMLPVCHAYFRVKDGEQIKPGMQVKMALENVDTQTYGYLLGTVFDVSEFPASDLDLLQVLRNPQLISYIKQGAPAVIAVLIHPILDPQEPSGYKWSSERGPNSYLKIGSICEVKIVTEDKRPISYLFPFWFTPPKEPLGENPNIYPDGHFGKETK